MSAVTCEFMQGKGTGIDMQISDMLGQYNKNAANGTEELRGAQSVQKLVSTVGELSAGSIFEGTVNHVRGGKVTLALGNGQVITARLDGKVDIKTGTAMFFQVKSNDGLTVSIRPYTGAANASNPILLNALTAAQVPATERGLMMVDAMMREQMSVDRQSILNMIKILNANPNANVQTIVQMTKLGMPVTEAMATQFENYLSDRHNLLHEMQLAVGQIAEALGDESITPEKSFALFSKVVDTLVTDSGAGQSGTAAVIQGQIAESVSGQGENTAAGMETGNKVQAGFTEGLYQENAPQAATQENVLYSDMSGNLTEKMGNVPGVNAGTAGQTGASVSQATLAQVLSEEQLASLMKSLQNIPTLVGNEDIFINAVNEDVFVDTMQDEMLGTQDMAETEAAQLPKEVVLNKEMTAGQFLQALQKALLQNSEYGFTGVQKLFAGKEFHALLKNVTDQQWLLEPQELLEKGKLDKLYEKMERQMSQMESVMREAGMTQNSFLHTAADIRGNIEFMNQMNQIYHYVQIPLKLSGQSANGELYVYSNRKKLNDPDAELTAFLHLDMEHLGSTDVSVRMQNRQVKTNFYLDDDSSYDIVQKHLPILEKRLKNKGYDCTITITNEKKNINFKENFVKKGQVLSGGSLHRYSFDVRA